jgi:hypothetical protein
VDIPQPPAIPESRERLQPTAGERDRPADCSLHSCPNITHLGIDRQATLRLAVVVHDAAEEFSFPAQGQDTGIRLEEIDSHSGPGTI